MPDIILIAPTRSYGVQHSVEVLIQETRALVHQAPPSLGCGLLRLELAIAAYGSSYKLWIVLCTPVSGIVEWCDGVAFQVDDAADWPKAIKEALKTIWSFAPGRAISAI